MRHAEDYVFDFTYNQPSNAFSLITSKVFKDLISDYLKEEKDKRSYLYELIESTFHGNLDALLTLFADLLKTRYADLKEAFLPLSRNKTALLQVIDGIYDFWRRRQRYVLLEASLTNDIYRLINDIDCFSQLIITTYRTIYENVLENSQRVYRELPSGANAGFLLTSIIPALPEELDFLRSVKFVQSMTVKPPFIVYTEANTRKGFFQELKKPLQNIISKDFIAVGIKIGGYLGLCYFSKRYLEFIVGLANLFEFADPAEIVTHSPEFVMVFGVKDAEECYYYASASGIQIGICPAAVEFDYFGYVKKMILTLHNLHMLKLGFLPIHGAGIEITRDDGKRFFITLLGDSGAGKSETIEAFKTLDKSGIVDVLTIYDDMGTFKEDNGKVFAFGTETGAFVRLDDLDTSYSFKSIDRAVYFNPDSVNARVVIPLSNYNEVKQLYRVDVFLLADNFSDGPTLTCFKDVHEAKSEFMKGERMAMKTTSENGVVSTFFANPFGPLQERTMCEPIIDGVFDCLYEDRTYVGRLRTRLSFDSSGPKRAAAELLKLIQNL